MSLLCVKLITYTFIVLLCFLSLIQPEAYDMMVRELGFEMKAQPSEKMKTPEELAREEKEKLQKLEVCV